MGLAAACPESFAGLVPVPNDRDLRFADGADCLPWHRLGTFGQQPR